MKFTSNLESMMLYHVLLWKTYNLLKWKYFKIVYLGTNTLNIKVNTRPIAFSYSNCVPLTFLFSFWATGRITLKFNMVK